MNDNIKCETIPLTDNTKERDLLLGCGSITTYRRDELPDMEHRIHILENVILDLQTTVMAHGEMINSIFNVLQRNNTTLLL